MNKYKIYILSLISLPFLLLTGCMKDDQWIEQQRNNSSTLPDKGLFVINEGNFMYGNASLSFYDPEKKQVQNDLFFSVNALPLGDVAQSMTIHNGLGYIVVNNSGKIYIINSSTGKYVGKITGLISPRYIHFISDSKAYITDLYAAAISVFNPSTGHITGTIPTPGHTSTETMVQWGDYLFVACWSGDHTVLMIDTRTDQVVNEIMTAAQPSGLALDKNNKLWVLCGGGNGAGQTAKLQRIDPLSLSIEKEFSFNATDKPSRLIMDKYKETLLFLNNGIWKMNVGADQLPDQPLFSSTGNLYYGLSIDPANSEIYFSDAIDYLQKGIIYRCSFEGAMIDSFKTGIIPGSFCFKQGQN